MKFSLSSGITALCLGLASAPGLATQAKVVGGQDAAADAAPWMVGLQDQGSPQASPFCGASLIAPRWVLTAAHCVEDVNADNPNLEVLVGAYRLSANDGEKIAVERIVIHPQYDTNTVDRDIALLKLSNDASANKVLPATPQVMQQTPVGTELTVRGWGVTRDGGDDQPDILQEVNVPLVAQDNCEAEVGDITDNMLCAGFASGGKDSCQGDSGGPLTRIHNGRAVQLGIVSWGAGCAQPSSPGVYTRVSQFNDWIQQTMAGTVSNPPPTDPDEPPSQPDPEEPPLAEFSDLSITEYLDFGMAFLDETLEDYVVVVNESEESLAVPDAQLDGSNQYSLDDSDCQGAVLEPGDYCFIDVTFEASQEGESEAFISLGDAESLLFAVTVSENEFDFGDADFEDGFDEEFDDWYGCGDDDWYADEGDLVADLFGDDEDYLSTEIDGEGELSFDWEGTDDVEADYFVDGARRASLNSGTSKKVTMKLPAGQHRLHWVARKQGPSHGQLRISNLQFTPKAASTPAPANNASETPTSSGQANLAAPSSGGGATSPMLILLALVAIARRKRRLHA